MLQSSCGYLSQRFVAEKRHGLCKSYSYRKEKEKKRVEKIDKCPKY
jgi:hypothetical protein